MSILVTTIDFDEDTFFETDSRTEEKEFSNKFKDARLDKRFQSLLKQFSNLGIRYSNLVLGFFALI